MTHYPKAKLPPPSVYDARIERRSHVMKAMFLGITIRSLIILGELAGVIFFGSSALLMDALASLFDVISSIFLIFFIRLAARPPDHNHPFGHGRFEPLAGLQLGLLLTVVGLGMCVQQGLALSESHAITLDKYIWVIPLAAIVLLEICYAVTMRAAKKHQSPALQADAAHYRVDSLTSLFATVALLGVYFFPSLGGIIDRVGALFISILMVVLGSFAMKSNLNQLMDHIPEQRYFRKVKRAAKRVLGVKDTEKIRIQLYGPDAHVDIDVEVDPEMSVEEAHEISQEVRAEIQKEWPQVRDVTVHIEPYYAGDH